MIGGFDVQLSSVIRRMIPSGKCRALALIFAVGLPTSASAVSLNETFMNSTAPGWNLMGAAVLTSGGVDPVGAGWLRLTSNATGQAGSAIYNTAFSSAAGVQVIFTYATWGAGGWADGISFYLIDGATGAPTVGAYGGSLGYSKGITSGLPGVTNGYLGIGLDEFGNFSTAESGDCNYVTCLPLGSPGGVTIRGSGSLSASGFNYYTHANATIPTVSRAGAKRVRITVTPAPTVNATVEIDSGSGFVTAINNFNISGIAGQAAIPATFKMGFGGSTGDGANYHEIRGFTTTNADPASARVVPTLNAWMLMLLACLLAVGGAATLRGLRY